jgi:hypothetical protein
MQCERCGSVVKELRDPYWLYKVVKGEVISKLFMSHKEPKGWYESPAAAKRAKSSKKLEKVDDDSTGYNQQLC